MIDCKCFDFVLSFDASFFPGCNNIYFRLFVPQIGMKFIPRPINIYNLSLLVVCFIYILRKLCSKSDYCNLDLSSSLYILIYPAFAFAFQREREREMHSSNTRNYMNSAYELCLFFFSFM